MDAYLDIETTGLSPYTHRVTVVGISFGDDEDVVQLVGKDINGKALTEVLVMASTIYTYNGTRFDLPFLDAHVGIDLRADFKHIDLMFDCWRRGLYGGLKVVEQVLGIRREVVGVDGLEAVRLWHRYERFHDHDALELLLAYNREDVLNLKRLRSRLLTSLGGQL
jgi:hypothetical protein